MTTDWAGEEITDEEESTPPAAWSYDFPDREPTKPPTWHKWALCHELSELFFAPQAERPEPKAMREWQAREICFKCPVKIQCRTYGRTNREFGIWGGENEEDRAKLGIFPDVLHGSVKLSREQNRQSKQVDEVLRDLLKEE